MNLIKKFFTIFLLFMVAEVASLMFWWASADVRWWYIVVLSLCSAIWWAYALSFLLIERIYPLPYRYTLRMNVSFAIVILAIESIYYSMLVRHVPYNDTLFSSLIYSASTRYVVAALFLVAHLSIVCYYRFFKKP